MHLLAERFVFFLGGDDRGVLKEGVKTYLMAPMAPLNLPTVFLSAHVHSILYNFVDHTFEDPSLSRNAKGSSSTPPSVLFRPGPDDPRAESGPAFFFFLERFDQLSALFSVLTNRFLLRWSLLAAVGATSKERSSSDE
jgi:hypothetical protein